jgi:hypothetical protein
MPSVSDFAERMNRELLEMRRHEHGTPLFWRAWMKLAALVDIARRERR